MAITVPGGSTPFPIFEELVQRELVTLLDLLREVDLLVGGQERDLPDLLEILVQHPLTAGDVHRRFVG